MFTTKLIMKTRTPNWISASCNLPNWISLLRTKTIVLWSSWESAHWKWCFFIHGLSMTCCSYRRLVGSFSSRPWMSCLASLEMFSHMVAENDGASCLIFWKVSSWSFPPKGVVPVSNKYRNIPNDQLSHLWLYTFPMTSGAR